MVQLSVIVGVGLFILGFLAVLTAFLIAVRQYVLHPPAQAASGEEVGPWEVLYLFLELLTKVIGAPPALGFLVMGVLILALSLWVLTVKPF